VLRGARTAQRGAHEGDQLVEHHLCALRVDADQHPQIRQRVEQHVRLELRFEQLQLVLGGLALRRLHGGLFAGDGFARVKPVGDHGAGHERAEQQGQHLAPVAAKVTLEVAPENQVGDLIAEAEPDHRADHDRDQHQGPTRPMARGLGCARRVVAMRPFRELQPADVDREPAQHRDADRLHQVGPERRAEAAGQQQRDGHAEAHAAQPAHPESLAAMTGCGGSGAQR